MTNNMTPEMIYMRLGRLIETMPDLVANYRTTEVQKWLATAHLLVKAAGLQSGDLDEEKALKKILVIFASQVGSLHMFEEHIPGCVNQITSILYRALANAELYAPTSVQESFIPAGADFDAFAAISKVFGKATKEILIVDPYIDEKIFTDFMPAIPEGVTAKLLASKKNHKSGILQPAFSRWVKQYSSTRPTELRVVSDKGLHDRLVIIDSTEVWLLSQSFNTFAERAPASIVRSQAPELKIEAHNDIWNNAEPIQS